MLCASDSRVGKSEASIRLQLPSREVQSHLLFELMHINVDPKKVIE